MSPRIPIDREKVEAFCKRWKIIELSLFGSVIWNDFREDSDVDVLVTYAPDAKATLRNEIAAEEELSRIVGRKVDLVEREAVVESPNWIRRRHILSHAEPYYVVR